jgi:hypothetical protein
MRFRLGQAAAGAAQPGQRPARCDLDLGAGLLLLPEAVEDPLPAVGVTLRDSQQALQYRAGRGPRLLRLVALQRAARVGEVALADLHHHGVLGERLPAAQTRGAQREAFRLGEPPHPPEGTGEIIESGEIIWVHGQDRAIGRRLLRPIHVHEAVVVRGGELPLDCRQPVAVGECSGGRRELALLVTPQVPENDGQLSMCHRKPTVERHRLLEQRNRLLAPVVLLEPERLGVLAECRE